MRTAHFLRAVAALVLAGALAISPALTNYAAAQRPLADVSHEEWQALSDACSNEKAAALAVLFPNGATTQQQEDFDHAFAQQLTGAASTQLMPQWQAFSEQSAAGAPHAAENAFAACVYHARIRQLDPNAAFPTPAQSQTDQLFANLPRRDGGAGANMIAQSLDPAARTERQRLQQQADAERQARQQQAAANNAAFWDTLLGVVATVGNAYVGYESQRAQIEANNQAAAAQAAANAALQQQQQLNNGPYPQPSQGGTSYTYLNGQCVGTGCPLTPTNPAVRHVHHPENEGTHCVQVRQTDHSAVSHWETYNGCPWPVEVEDPDGLIELGIGSVYPVFTTPPFQYWACRYDRRQGVGIMHNPNGEGFICVVDF
jgi:hypothetical protein